MTGKSTAEQAEEIKHLKLQLQEENIKARTIAFQDVLNSIQDRQVRDHVARCLQDKFGVWWKTAEEK